MKHSTLQELFAKNKRVHLVGLSPKADRDSNKVASYLLEQGFEVVCIRPNTEEVLGQCCYDSLEEAPGPVEIVDVFRASEHVPAIVDQAIAVGATVLWLQEGVSHPEAEEKARNAGLTVFSNQCIKKAHQKLSS